MRRRFGRNQVGILALAGILTASGSVVARAQVASPATTAPPATATPAAVQTIVKHVARGVDLIQEITPADAAGGPLLITIIRADPRVPGVRIEAALGQDRVWNTDPTFGREIVSRIVTRHKAVAGVNAGYFPFAGNPYGVHIDEGDLVTVPLEKQTRTSFYLTKSGATGFAPYHYVATANIAGKVDADSIHAIDGLNRKPGGEKSPEGELLLFTPIWSPTTLPIAGRVEVVLRDVKVPPLVPNQEYVGTVVSQTVGGNTPVAPGTVVLSGIGPGADFLRTAAQPGAKIAFRLRLAPDATTPSAPDPQTLREVVTGGPRILTNGVITDRYREEGFGKDHSATSHPRTAIGRTADGVLLLMTVDGRQKGVSKGAPLPDLAAILKRFGAVDGLNLDGGGSSAAVVWDGVVNSPSEGVERPIADALLVYADDLKSPKKAEPVPTVNAPTRSLQVGETWNFATPALMQNDHAVWGVKGGVGAVSQNGVFRAMRPGKGTVMVAVDGRAHTARAAFTVVGVSKLDAAGFAPRLMLLPADAATPLRQTLTIHIANAEGDPLASEPVALDVTGGKPETPTVTTDAHGDAQVAIVWDAPISASAPHIIKVTSPRMRFTSGSLSFDGK